MSKRTSWNKVVVIGGDAMEFRIKKAFGEKLLKRQIKTFQEQPNWLHILHDAETRMVAKGMIDRRVAYADLLNDERWKQ